MNKKYVIVSGGVISGIGKGVTSAATGFFFCEKYKVTTIKLDGYLNIDPGTMNPIEHGEVFVLDDGGEVDMDFGHYERFIGNSCKRTQSISMGKVYSAILEKERAGGFLGKTVQMIPHVTDQIISMIETEFAKDESDICIIEIGGTVGDIEAELYFEAIRQIKQQKNPEDILHIHLTYIPIPGGVKEQKTKPTQQSVQLLQSRGLFPDMIIARGTEFLTESAEGKIALYSNIHRENVFSIPDVESIYTIPKVLLEQDFLEKIQQKLNIELPLPKKYEQWNKLVSKEKKKKVTVGLVGKYTSLEDSYSSVVSALKHSAFHLGIEVKVKMISTRKKGFIEKIKMCDASVVPGGFWDTGIENMIQAVEFLRTEKIPTLGICLWMQIMLIEFFRNVLKNKKANSLEFDINCAPNDIITLLESQKNVVNLGGTMRLGRQESVLEKGKILDLYKKMNRVSGKNIVAERFRHRYEFNPKLAGKLAETHLKVVGRSEKEGIAQFIEMDKKAHPYFVATQSHPELKSKLEVPAPLFYGLLESLG